MKIRRTQLEELKVAAEFVADISTADWNFFERVLDMSSELDEITVDGPLETVLESAIERYS